MRCRWLLCLEDYADWKLNLLAVAPRKWFEDGQVIDVAGMKSYFGQVSYTVESKVGVGRIAVKVNVDSGNGPAARTLAIRLPHPEGKKARYATAGRYCAGDETVTFDCFDGFAEFELIF